MSEDTFTSLLASTSTSGFILWELKEFPWQPPTKKYRVWLHHPKVPLYIHGIGWGPDPFSALQDAIAYHKREVAKDKATPPTLTLKDLGLLP